jgi:hypothetical protein
VFASNNDVVHRSREVHVHRSVRLLALCAFVGASFLAPSANADTGKLLLTGGVASIDGAAGGGLTPWAVIGSYAAAGQTGFTAHLTRVVTKDFGLTTYGVAAAIDDRFEASLTQQEFNSSAAVPGTTLRQSIVGAKIRLTGDAVLDSDTWMPQISAGIEFKHAAPGDTVGAVLDFAGAKRSGTDIYLSGTKLFLGESVLLNATVRATRANQNGLLGYGSSDNDHYQLMPEISVAMLLRRNLAIGAEYRSKPDNLAFAGATFKEDAWRDLFVAYAPNKRLSLTAAIVDLGNIVGNPKQTGVYLSGQLSY